MTAWFELLSGDVRLLESEAGDLIGRHLGLELEDRFGTTDDLDRGCDLLGPDGLRISLRILDFGMSWNGTTTTIRTWSPRGADTEMQKLIRDDWCHLHATFWRRGDDLVGGCAVLIREHPLLPDGIPLGRFLGCLFSMDPIDRQLWLRRNRDRMAHGQFEERVASTTGFGFCVIDVTDRCLARSVVWRWLPPSSLQTPAT